MDLGELNVVIGANIQPLQASMDKAAASMATSTKIMRASFTKAFKGATEGMTIEMQKMQQINKAAFEQSNKVMAVEMQKMVNGMTSAMIKAFAKTNKVAVAGIKKVVRDMQLEMAKGIGIGAAPLSELQLKKDRSILNQKTKATKIAAVKDVMTSQIETDGAVAVSSNKAAAAKVKADATVIKSNSAVTVSANKTTAAQITADTAKIKSDAAVSVSANKVAAVQIQADARVTASSIAAEAKNNATAVKAAATAAAAQARAQKALAMTSDRLRRIGWDIERMGRGMMYSLTLPIVAAGAASYKMASDYDENLNKIRVAFGESSAEVEAFAKTALTATGMSESMAMKTAGLFGDMATSMGLTRKEAAKLSIELTQLVGDAASFKNMNFDEVKTAFQGIFTGETESLKRMGVVMTVEAVQEWADAMEKGVKYADLAISERVKLRAEYVKNFMKNSVGDFGRTINQTANQMRIFQSTLQELGTSFGHILMKTLTPLLTGLNRLLKGYIGLDEEQKNFWINALKYLALAGPAFLAVGWAIGTMIPALTTVFKLLGSIAVFLITNPWVALAAAIIAAGAAIWYFSTRLSETEKITKKYTDAADDATDSIRKEQATLNLQIKQTTLMNIGSAERTRKILALAKAYPELTDKLLDAKDSDQKLLGILKDINIEYAERIRLASLHARIKVADDESVAAQVTIDKLREQRDALILYERENTKLIATLQAQVDKQSWYEKLQGDAEGLREQIATIHETIALNRPKIEDFNKQIEENQKNLNGYLATGIKLYEQLGKEAEKADSGGDLGGSGGATKGIIATLEEAISKFDEDIKKATTAESYIELTIDKTKAQNKLDIILAQLKEIEKPIKVDLQIELSKIALLEKLAKLSGEKYDATGARITAYSNARQSAAEYQSLGAGNKSGEMAGYSKEMTKQKGIAATNYLGELDTRLQSLNFDNYVDQLAGIADEGGRLKKVMDLWSEGIRHFNNEFKDTNGNMLPEAAAGLKELEKRLKATGTELAQFSFDSMLQDEQAALNSMEALSVINQKVGNDYDLLGEQISFYTKLIDDLNALVLEAGERQWEYNQYLQNTIALLIRLKSIKPQKDFERDIQNIRTTGKAYEELGIQVNSAADELDVIKEKAISEVRSGGFVTPETKQNYDATYLSATQKEVANGLQNIGNLESVAGSLGNTFDATGEKIGLFEGLLNKAKIDGQVETIKYLEETMKSLGLTSSKVFEEMKQTAFSVAQAFDSAFTAMADKMVESIETGSDAMAEFQKILLKTAMKILSMALSNALAMAIQGGSTAGASTGPAAPFTTPMFIAELMGGVFAAFASIPKFKDGGVVSGPTLGVFGEYPGAKSNPEVVAPLDRLQKYMQPENPDDIVVRGQLAGSTIYLTNERYGRRKQLVQ